MITVATDHTHMIDSPDVIISDIEYGTHNVTVLLRWIPENGVTYNISTEPEVETVINFNTMSTAQITLSYNTHYNVSVLATSVCGRARNHTAIEFYYG